MSKIKKPKHLSSNPLVNGILLHLNEAKAAEIAENGLCQRLAQGDLPKRFTWYDPLILLNERFEQHSKPWFSYYSALSVDEQEHLFAMICRSFNDSGKPSTHIAVNAPIQAHLEDNTQDNILRAPKNLKPLFGDFGSSTSSKARPSQHDFDAALWIQTAQIPGIIQIWAPRWTMFSRGNIREKARILGNEQHNPSPFPGLSAAELNQKLDEIDVVDFYVGIGYFAIPYLTRGVGRVFGWELNGWSIEGLTRGCLANGLKCKTYHITATDKNSLIEMASTVATDIKDDPNIRCFAFHGDNNTAPAIINHLGQLLENNPAQLNIRHCNLGLLPSSSQAYISAIPVLSKSHPGWLHIHENVDINAVQQKQAEIQHQLNQYISSNGQHTASTCSHIEMVKTYAPGIGHFVFDMLINHPSPH